MSPDVLFQDLEVNAAYDWQGHVPHRHASWCATSQCSQMGMTMNDEIRRSPVEHDPQLAISKHPVLGKRLLSERGRGRSEVDRRNVHVRVKREQCTFERLALAAGTESKSLQGSRMDRVWPFMRPEPAATAGCPGDADARPVRQANHGGASVEHLDATAFERAPERYSAQRSQVVVPQDRDDGQPRGHQEIARHLGFQQATVLREIAGDEQQIGPLRETGQAGHRARVFSSTDVEVPNRRYPDPHEL
jgi:hypothetical protein